MCFPYKMMPINMVVHQYSLLQGPQFDHDCYKTKISKFQKKMTFL